MSYKYSKGATVQGDIKAADDSNRDTMIDFSENKIELQTGGETRIVIDNNGQEIEMNLSELEFNPKFSNDEFDW